MPIDLDNTEEMFAASTDLTVGLEEEFAVLDAGTLDLELGRAQKTIFLCRYLRDRGLQREINSGLNVVEGWHDVNDVILFGKSGEFASNQRDQQETHRPLAPSPAGGARLRQHADDPRHPRRTRMGRAPHRRG